MRKPVPQLTLDELDYAVARIERLFYMRDPAGQVFGIDPDGRITCTTSTQRFFIYTPTRDWRQAGPIIESRGISIQKIRNTWTADIGRETAAEGDTPLEAAMRALVVQAFGPEIDLDE